MSAYLNRRTFLGTSAVAGISALGAKPGLAIEPIHRGDWGPKFKFSLAAYSYRSLLSGKDPQLTMFDFVDECARMGLDGTELTSYYFPSNVDPEYLNKLKAKAFRLGLDVSGTAVGNDFGFADDERRTRQIDDVKQWIDHASILGAPVIRIFAGKQKPSTSPEESYRLMVSGIEACCEYAGTHGIFLALENHGGPTATAEGLLQFVGDVKSPWFGVNLDTGNFHTPTIYEDLEKVAPYALNVQVKVVIAGPDRKKVPTDFARLAAILRDADYRGYVVLEYEEKGDPRIECPKFMNVIREAFAYDA